MHGISKINAFNLKYLCIYFKIFIKHPADPKPIYHYIITSDTADNDFCVTLSYSGLCILIAASWSVLVTSVVCFEFAVA